MTPTIARIAIVWGLLLAGFLGIAQLATALFGAAYALDRHVFTAVLTSAVTVPIILLARRHLDREPVAGLGLGFDTAAVKALLVGALAWLAPFLLGLFLCLGLGLVAIEPVAGWGEIIAFVPLLIGLVFLLEALPEELAFRGYLQANLARLAAPWLAIAIQAVLFGSWAVALWLITTGSVDPAHASLFYVMGAVLGMLRMITGSLWSSIGFHLAFQTVAQLLMHDARGHFAIEGTFWLQIVALGVLPFSLAVPIVERFYRQPVAWRQRPA